MQSTKGFHTNNHFIIDKVTQFVIAYSLWGCIWYADFYEEVYFSPCSPFTLFMTWWWRYLEHEWLVKKLQFNLWATWMSIPNSMVIHHIVEGFLWNTNVNLTVKLNKKSGGVTNVIGVHRPGAVNVCITRVIRSHFLGKKKKFMRIHSVVEIFYSGPKWWTCCQNKIPKSLASTMANNYKFQPYTLWSPFLY